jgi:hypothetical protein
MRCRTVYDAQGGYQWSVVFNSSMGNVPQLVAYSSLTPSTFVNVQTATVRVSPLTPLVLHGLRLGRRA